MLETCGCPVEFLSTPSARRATTSRLRPVRNGQISIHALREEGDELTMPLAVDVEISIHALREEGDIFLLAERDQPFNFYPRPPRGGRHRPTATPSRPSNFYPRPPRGGRQQKQRQNLYFQTNYTTFCTNLEEP